MGQSFNEGISDDIPLVVPFGAKASLISFVEQYRNALQVLNLRAAGDDPSCTKAFDCSQEDVREFNHCYKSFAQAGALK